MWQLMKSKIQLLILLSLALSSCGIWNETSGSAKGPISKPSVVDPATLIRSLENISDEVRKEGASQLLALARRSTADQNTIAESLIEESRMICSRNNDGFFSDVSLPRFYKLRTMSDILAELQREAAVEMLIDCSDYSSPVGGYSAAHFATMPAILSYKEKAKPILMRKMVGSSNAIKCNIADALAAIGGDEVRAFLVKGKESENDRGVLSCMTACIRFIDRK